MKKVENSQAALSFTSRSGESPERAFETNWIVENS